MAGIDPISAIASVAQKVLGAVLPDKAAEQAARARLGEMALNGELSAAAQEIQLAQDVNATMRAESASTHWLQWAWRPIIGLVMGAVIVNNFILLPYLAAYGIQPIVIPDEVWKVMLATVGVSALSRGVEKIVQQYKQAS